MEKHLLIELVQKAQNGDANAQQTLYTNSFPRVYYLALKLLRSPADAEDITQEVFISVFQNLATLRDPATFPSWLSRITANHCTSYLRKKRELLEKKPEDIAQAAGTEPDSIMLPQPALDDTETRRMILEIVDQLPTAQRLCVYYYYFEQMTVAQVAENLECSEGTVKSRLSAAREKIRTELERKNKEEGIKLYGVPLALASILQQSLQEFQPPANIAPKIWQDVQLASTAPAAQPHPQQQNTAANGQTSGLPKTGAAVKPAVVKIVAGACAAVAVAAVSIGIAASLQSSNAAISSIPPQSVLSAAASTVSNSNVINDEPSAPLFSAEELNLDMLQPEKLVHAYANYLNSPFHYSKDFYQSEDKTQFNQTNRTFNFVNGFFDTLAKDLPNFEQDADLQWHIFYFSLCQVGQKLGDKEMRWENGVPAFEGNNFGAEFYFVPKEPVIRYAYEMFGVDISSTSIAQTYTAKDDPSCYLWPTGFGGIGGCDINIIDREIQNDRAITINYERFGDGFMGNTDYQGTYALKLQLMKDGNGLFLRFVDFYKK